MFSLLLKSTPYVIASILCFTTNTWGSGEHGGVWYTVTKCLPPAILLVYCFTLFRPSLPLQFNHTVAVLLGFVGDVILAFRSLSTTYFLMGTVVFGLGHYFYLRTFFLGPKPTSSVSSPRLHRPILGVMAGWNVVLGLLCLPYLLKEPFYVPLTITVYGLVLSFTLSASYSVWKLKQDKSKTGAFVRMLGWSTFVMSDTMVILDQYHVVTIPQAQLYILITYFLAQLLIFLGSHISEMETSRKRVGKKK